LGWLKPLLLTPFPLSKGRENLNASLKELFFKPGIISLPCLQARMTEAKTKVERSQNDEIYNKNCPGSDLFWTTMI